MPYFVKIPFDHVDFESTAMNLQFRLFCAVLLVCFSSIVAAGPMHRHVERVRPRVAQRGTTVEMTIKGTSLGKPREIIFFNSGIKAIDIQPMEHIPRIAMVHGSWIDQQFRCKFVIAKDCPIGEHTFRVRTETQLTNIGTFHVSPFPVIDEDEKGSYANDTLEKAKLVPTTVTVRGVLNGAPRGDRDVYRVPVEKGQRLAVEVDCVRIADEHYGDSEFDTKLRILDEIGTVIAENDDNSTHIQDPLAVVLIKKSGFAFVEVSRSVFAQRENTYSVHIGRFARPTTVFPVGGQPGTQQKVKLLGDPLETITATVEIPKSVGDFKHFLDGPSALRLRSSTLPNVFEDTRSAVTRIEKIPVALNGIIDNPQDSDTYRIDVQKGKTLHVRVFAASVGSSIDAGILIRRIADDSTGSEIEVEHDDSSIANHNVYGTGFRSGGGMISAIDPVFLWTPKHDGSYEIEVVDNGGLGGPTGVYRVEIVEPQTTLHTYLRSRTNDWTESMRVSGIIVPRGNRWTTNISISKGLGRSLTSDFDIVAHGLPKGMTLVAPRLKPGTTIWPLQFVADENVQPIASRFTLEAIPVDGSSSVITTCQQNVPFINHSGGDAWRIVRTDKFISAITQSAPFTIELEQPRVGLVQGGELSLPVKVTRHGDFKGEVEIRCGYVPRSISYSPPTIIAADQDSSVLQLGASTNATIEDVPLVVLGTTVRDDMTDYLGAGHVRVSSKFVRLSVTKPFVQLTAQPASIRRGEKKSFTWNVKHQMSFTGQASVKLLGLPKGVSVVGPNPSFAKSDSVVTFQLEATNAALLGQATGLQCEVSIPVNGQKIVQRSGLAKLRIDPKL